MLMHPIDRQEQILTWLRKERSLTIDELAARLNVSAMTIHRDLDTLAETGQVQKHYGGAQIVQQRSAPLTHQHTCNMCQITMSSRTTFVIQRENADALYACCPHCGLLLLAQSTGAASALTRDFIYGRMINVTSAVYLLESGITLCCMPGVLCFATTDDAARFQLGFGGTLMDYTQACAYLTRQHNISNT